MSDYRDMDGYSDGHDGDIIGRDEVNRAANAFKHSTSEAFAHAEIGKNKKFLGVTMDAGIADMLAGAYNVSADFISTSIRPKIGTLAERGAQKMGIAVPAAKTVGMVASVGSTVALKTGAYFGTVYEGFAAQWKEQIELARKISPVLDDIKGNHSLAVLYTTGINDNEIIFAHRKRLGKIADNRHLTNITNLAINSGGSLLLDIKTIAGEIKGQQLPTPVAAAPDAAAAPHDHATNQAAAWQALKTGGVGILPQFANRLALTNDYKLQKELQPYSALEMILELADQVNSNSKASGFTVPRSFQAPHGRREQYSLEEYLMRICIQHQKDMAYLDPKYTEIREALRDDLAATVKPLADAIRQGDYNVLGLVRLVGEGKIIKKQGRAIAPAADIEALIEKEEPKQAIYAPIDPTEYYKDATFSRAQMKGALKALDGDDKRIFASMFPDSILLEAGMARDEVQNLRKATAAKYDHMLAEAILGLNAKTDDVLKTDGLAHSEIEQIRDAARKIEEQGDKALHDLKTSAVNDHGIEHLLANVVVHQPKYLGTVMHEGRTKLETPANDDDAVPRHAEREHGRRQHGQATKAQLN